MAPGTVGRKTCSPIRGRRQKPGPSQRVENGPPVRSQGDPEKRGRWVSGVRRESDAVDQREVVTMAAEKRGRVDKVVRQIRDALERGYLPLHPQAEIEPR